MELIQLSYDNGDSDVENEENGKIKDDACIDDETFSLNDKPGNNSYVRTYPIPDDISNLLIETRLEPDFSYDVRYDYSCPLVAYEYVIYEADETTMLARIGISLYNDTANWYGKLLYRYINWMVDYDIRKVMIPWDMLSRARYIVSLKYNGNVDVLSLHVGDSPLITVKCYKTSSMVGGFVEYMVNSPYRAPCTQHRVRWTIDRW